MNTKSKSIPVSDAQALLSTLKETFPVFLNHEPLAIGIDKQILARLPETAQSFTDGACLSYEIDPISAKDH
jgi:hypothetical protein